MTDRPNYKWTQFPHAKIIEDEWRMGRLVTDDDVTALVRKLCKTSRRTGAVGGTPTRSFHLRISSFKVAPTRRQPITTQGRPRDRRKSTTIRESSLRRRIGQKLAYVHRTGQYSGAVDLVASGGIEQARLQEAAVALGLSSARSNANVVTEIVMELPAGTPARRCRMVAEVMRTTFGRSNCPASYAIHNHEGNLHLHFLVTARPCREVAPGYWVAEAQGRPGSPGFRLFRNRAHIKEFRERIAGVINSVCEPEIQFHGGCRAETGLAGRPELRVSRNALAARQKRVAEEIARHIAWRKASLSPPAEPRIKPAPRPLQKNTLPSIQRPSEATKPAPQAGSLLATSRPQPPKPVAGPNATPRSDADSTGNAEFEHHWRRLDRLILGAPADTVRTRVGRLSDAQLLEITASAAWVLQAIRLAHKDFSAKDRESVQNTITAPLELGLRIILETQTVLPPPIAASGAFLERFCIWPKGRKRKKPVKLLT